MISGILRAFFSALFPFLFKPKEKTVATTSDQAPRILRYDISRGVLERLRRKRLSEGSPGPTDNVGGDPDGSGGE